MGLFSRNKKEKSKGHHKSALLTVLKHEQLTAESARISFEIPSGMKESYVFKAGQYLNLHCDVNGTILNRSYSICSGESEVLSVAVKAVNGGQASNWLVNNLKAGDEIEVDFPAGNFGLQADAKKHVAFAAGSGITPILSMAKSLEGKDGEMTLFYSNSTQASTFFSADLNALTKTKTHYYYSRETVEGAATGRFDKQLVSEIIKQNLSLLRAEAFYICGPEEMIAGIKEVLEVFGIRPDQIHFELFTTPVLLVPEPTDVVADYTGDSDVSAILDGEVVSIKLHTNGKTVLDALDSAGMDVPYSCKGGVCCTCKAKIIEGSVNMRINYALTDEEVKQGYILTCQSHPTSPVLKIDFDV